jgi:IS1 family transposase
MNKLSTAKRVAVIAALVEGSSVNSTVRMTGVSKPTILKLLADIGCACAAYHHDRVRNIAAKRVQCDETWAFCYSKQKNVPALKLGQFGYGDVWTWVATDADTKLVISYMLGLRDAGYGTEFMKDVASRLSTRVQLTSDGHRAYLAAVPDAFGEEIDYAQLVKLYGVENPGAARYSPSACTGCIRRGVSGDPDPHHISTSFVERQNLSMRMGMRRFTRLTNGFSKKVENYGHAVALYFMYYNFCRVHQTLKQTPAMAAGLTDRAWTIDDLVAMLN